MDSTDDALAATTGTCTLRGAVDAINNGGNANGCTNSVANAYGTNDTIVVAAALAGSTIPVTASGQIEIAKTLTITGLLDASGQPNVTLDGNDANRILYVTNGSSLTITGLRFINGFIWDGTTYMPSTLYLQSSGGAIALNVATAFALTLQQCAFEDNYADFAGGAVHNQNPDTTINIVSSTFSGNSVHGYYGGSNGYWGGAVYNIYNSNTAHTNIDNSTFTNNEATRGSGAVAASDVTISNSTFDNNRSLTGDGGAVFGWYTNFIRDSVFSNNTAGDWGGAVRSYGTIDVGNSTFIGNTAVTKGGALYTATGPLTVRHATFLNNTAPDGQAAYIASALALSLSNSIIIGSSGSAQCVGDPGSTITGVYNLEGYYDGSGNWQGSSATCGTNIATLPNTGDALGTIIASTLANNGGPTQTLALPAGSPATAAADPTTGGTSQTLNAAGAWVDAALDQRGHPRASDPGQRSVGAYEGVPRIPPFAGQTSSIPALPMPLLLALMALMGIAAARKRRR